MAIIFLTGSLRAVKFHHDDDNEYSNYAEDGDDDGDRYDNDNGDDDGLPIASNCVDTVLTNPPFGTKHNAGIDLTFLRTAIRLATKAVYSFHKSSTSRYLIKAVESWGYEVEVVAQMKFEIPKMYKFHKQNEVDVEVDLIRVNVVSKSP